MRRRILISRRLTAAEDAAVRTLQQDGWAVQPFSAAFYSGARPREEPDAETKRRINYQVMEEILCLGDLDAGGQAFADLFRSGQASLWHYHKFRIYFAVRNLCYDLEQAGPDEKEDLIWYAGGEWRPVKALFPGVDFRFEVQAEEKLNLFTLLQYLTTVSIRLLWSLIPARGHSDYLVYFAEKDSTILDPETLRPVKGHHILEYLINRLDGRFALLTEVIVPKLKGRSDFSFGRRSLLPRRGARRKEMAEAFLVRGWLSRKLKREWRLAAQVLKEGYLRAGKTPMNLHQQMALEVLKSLDKTSVYYLFRYLAARRFFGRRKLKAVAASDENSPLTRSVLDGARSCGIRIIGLQHGSIHDLHPAYRYTEGDRACGIMPDLTLVWGERWKRFLLEKGHYPEDSVRVTGQLRTDVIPGLLRHMPKKNVPPVVVFASQPQRDPQLRRRAARDVFSAVSAIPGCRLIVRLHPREFGDAAYYRAIAEEVGCSDYTTDLHSDLYQLIASCDVLITCFSTVGTETVYFEKPLIVLDHLKQDIQGYVREGVAFQASDAGELQRLLAGVLDGSLRIDRERYRAFIENYACRIDGQTAGRVIAAITSV